MLKIVFVCIHNSCRSQMAQAWGKEILKDVAKVYSAGVETYPEVKPLAITVMQESGIDISKEYPKLLSDIPGEIDILITMGCGVKCPSISSKHKEDWGLEDPSGKTFNEFRITRDLIKCKVLELKARIMNNEFI